MAEQARIFCLMNLAWCRRIHPSAKHGRGMRAVQRGASLPELMAMVMVAGGVSAAALPRLNELPREARVAVVKTMEGAVRSATSLTHMKCAVQAGCDLRAGQASVEADGDEVLLQRGYPRGGDARGIENAIEFTGFKTAHGAGTTEFRQMGAPDDARGAVRYEEPQVDGQRPTISALTAGC